MKIIGITGGVGSGKSTVLDWLKNNSNSYIMKTDEIAKKLMNPGNIGFEKTIELFGDSILSSDKTINRKKLAEIIFNNFNKRTALNSIIHPLVKNSVIAEINRLKIEDIYDYIFVESALLLEDHYEKFCDELWYVYVSEEERRKRLKDSRGYTDEKIDSIYKSQLKESIYKEKCDKIIDNSKDFDFTISALVKML